METLKLLSNGIQGTASRDVVAELIASFVSLQKDATERQLLESLPDCVACLEGMEHADRGDIRLVLEKITRGQMLDLQRFDRLQEIRALNCAADLEEYTYLVAGCVGEFWTRVCFRHIRHFASQTEEQMLESRRELDRQLRPYRGKMTAAQLSMLESQYLDRRLLESTRLPRLSLFYLR